MDCEKCGGEVYDNTRKNQERADRGEKPMPQYKCKDRSCGWVKWPPKGQKAQGGGNGTSGGNTPGRSRWTWGDLFAAYKHCHEHAVKVLGEKADQQALQAATATMLIAAKDHGLVGPLTAVKDKQAAEAAKKKAALEAAQRAQQPKNFEDFPDELRDEEDDLPF